jgi:hypothetical protein
LVILNGVARHNENSLGGYLADESS